MYAITDFINASPMLESLRQELADEFIRKQHAIHVHLPVWLAPVFGLDPDGDRVQQLGFSSYLYFRFLLTIDHLLDAAPAATPAPGSVAVTPRRLLAYCELFEQAVRSLAGLFPPADPFWAHFAVCKQRYAASVLREKQLSETRGIFSVEEFEQLAAGKSAVCDALVYALSSLSGCTAPVEALLGSLYELHVALQCMDDVDDFLPDWEQQQYTYLQARLLAYLQAQGVDYRALTPPQLHSYLYTSGIAGQLYEKAEHHFQQATTLLAPFDVAELRGLLAHYIERCRFYRADIEQKLARATQRLAQPALTV